MNPRESCNAQPLIALLFVLFFSASLVVPLHWAFKSQAVESPHNGLRDPNGFAENDQSSRHNDAVGTGDPAPDFEMEKLDGSVIRLSPLISSHKIVVLNFFATWCGPCREELPHLSDIGIDLKSEGVLVVAVSSESTEEILEFAGDHYPGVLFARDIGSQGHSAFAIKGIPATFLITSDSKVQAVFPGYVQGREIKLRAQIKALLNPATPENASPSPDKPRDSAGTRV